MQTMILSSPPTVARRKRTKMQDSCALAENPMFRPSAAAMTKKGRSGTKPSRRFAMRLPMESSFSDSQGPLDIIRHALHEVQELDNWDESAPISTTKCVNFNLRLNNEIEPDSTPLSDEEIQQSWWRSHEYRAAADLYSKEVQSFIENHEESVSDLLSIVSKCNQSSCDELNEQLGNSSLESSLPRGSESDVVPVIKLLRFKHRQAVIEYVNKIPKHLKPALRERMLCARSIQFSRPHKMLARLLGEADAISCQQS
jgi:hypothetical protein